MHPVRFHVTALAVILVVSCGRSTSTGGGTTVGGETGAGRGAGGTEGGTAGEASGSGGSGAAATDCSGEVDLSLPCDTDLVCPNGCGVDCHCRNGSWSCAEPDFDTFVGKPCDAPGSCFYDLGDDGSFDCDCSSPGAHGESHWDCDHGLGSCTGVDGESCEGYALDFSCWNDTDQVNCTCTSVSAGGRHWQCEA